MTGFILSKTEGLYFDVKREVMGLCDMFDASPSHEEIARMFDVSTVKSMVETY